jgi:hypothetical protein
MLVRAKKRNDVIGQRVQLFRKNAGAVDQLRCVTRIRATDVANANNARKEEIRLCVLMKTLIENVVKETNTKGVEKRHHEAVVQVRERRRMLNMIVMNGDLVLEMEETHCLAEAVMVMVIATMTLVVDHIVGHRVGVTMNQTITDHDEVEIRVQMEVMPAVANENDVKVLKGK